MAVYVTGDKHGEIEMSELTKRNRSVSLDDGDKLIIAGDFGLVWKEKSIKQDHWRRWLNKSKWETLFVDGNHENFELLNKMPAEQRWGGDVGRVGEKIWHLKRGEIYNIEGIRILAMGGASSTDRSSRIQGMDWWPEEIPSHAEVSHCIDNIIDHDNDVDYVITHTCPMEVADWLSGNFGWGKAEDPTTKMLSHIASIVSFKQWLFGHWHVPIIFGKYRCLYHDFARLNTK